MGFRISQDILDCREMRVPRTVWALGFVSLCMDLSSELVHGLLPVFMTAVLGAGMVAVGVVEGIAEATASIAKLFSGVLSDRLGRRKPLVVFGYALAAASKPLFPLAGSVPLVLVARFMDRVGKGIRGAPRDALITDVTPAQARGAGRTDIAVLVRSRSGRGVYASALLGGIPGAARPGPRHGARPGADRPRGDEPGL